MKRKFAALLGASALAVSGAAQAAPRDNLVTVVDFTSDCVGADAGDGAESLAGSLLSLVIGPAVGAAIKGLGSALANAAAPDEVHVVGQTATYFYAVALPSDEASIVRYRKCVRFASGVKGGDGVALTGRPEDPGGPKGAAWLPSVGFARAPGIYMEVRLEVSHDRSAFRLVPVQAYVGKPFTEGGFHGKGRDLTVTISLLEPSKDGNGDALATRSLLLSRVANEAPVAPDQLAALATDWIPMPPLADAAKSRLADTIQRRKDRDELEKAEAKKKTSDGQQRLTRLKGLIAKDDVYLAQATPVTFRVDVHEVRDGDKVIAGIGKWLSDNSDKVAAPVTERLDPAERRKTAAADATQADSLRIAAIQAVEDWQTTEADAKSTAGQKRVKKIQAQAACRALRDAGHDDTVCAEVDG